MALRVFRVRFDCSLSDSISLEVDASRRVSFVEVSPGFGCQCSSGYLVLVFLPCFRKIRPKLFLQHRDFDCSIDLKPGSEPFHGKIYQLTREEDKVMQEWIKDNLRKGFIRNSSSPHGAPCFFVKQKDKLRLCMDYRGLTRIQLRIGIPYPLISELLRTLSTGKIFTTLDLRGAYNLLRIKEGDESKTSFITKYGQFEFLVMPFGLANAPAQFQRMMNSLFRDVIGKHVLVYLDDIVIYSDNMSDHIVQVQNVLRVLQDNWTLLQGREVPFLQVGNQEQEKSLQDLKTAFANSDFLTHPMTPGRLYWRPMHRIMRYPVYSASTTTPNTLRPIAFLCAPDEQRLSKTMKSTTKSCWLSSSHSNIGGISFKAVSIQSPSCAITRTWSTS
ncbi:hypothetical protein BASA81_016658 [Batrachochytrium salamandrivorans]|nr:hypothetical protein BASA81_016658 [Batrachochytrium salamandrivorans]